MNTNPTPENIATYIAEMAKRGYPTFTPEDVQHAIMEAESMIAKMGGPKTAPDPAKTDIKHKVWIMGTLSNPPINNATQVRTDMMNLCAEPMVMHRLTITTDGGPEYPIIAARPVDSFDPADYHWYIEAPAYLFAFLNHRLDDIENAALSNKTGIPAMVRDLLLAQDDIFEDAEETPTT